MRRFDDDRCDRNVICLQKGEERYIYVYTDERQADLIRHFGKQATNQELSFSWYDAAVLSQKIRSQSA